MRGLSTPTWTCRHRQLPVGDLDVLWQPFQRVRADHLIGVEHGLHGERVAQRPERDQVLLLAQHDARDGDLLRLPHRLQQQRVSLGGALVRDHVVAGVVVDGVDLLQVDEVQDVDGPRSLGVERLQLLGRDHDVLVAGDLVALDDVLKGDLLAVLGADPLLLDAGAVLVVQLVEPDVLLRGRGEELDGHVDQTETDGAAPDGSWHGS